MPQASQNHQRRQRHRKQHGHKMSMVPASEPETAGEESKRDRFVRIGTSRMNRALNSIRLIGNLASYNYDWNVADISHIRNQLHEAIDRTLAKFDRRQKGAAKPAFAFEPEKETS